MASKEQSSLNGWPLPKRQAVVVDLLSGRDTLAGLAHQYHLDATTILAWKAAFLEARLH